jgi:hypothetical protein
VTAARLKRMGVMPGWPDLMFVGAGGTAKTATRSIEETSVARSIASIGHGVTEVRLG